jgi:hypothetical protein
MRRLLALGTLLLATPRLSAQVTVLDFEGITSLAAPVGGFYSGLGVTFGDNATALCLVTFPDNQCRIANASRGGVGDVSSAGTGMFFSEGTSTSMNVLGGFNSGFSFFYSAPYNPGSVSLYDGLNGTGNLLRELNLPTTIEAACGPDYASVNFCPFAALGVAFEGTAYSAVWSGVLDQIIFDDITLGSDIPGRQDVVPEPATMTLLATGLAGMAAARKKRRTA